MRTDKYQSSCFTMLFHMVIELLFTGEVYQYKDLKVYSSISGKKILVVKYFWWENTISAVQQFSWKDFHKYGVFLW